MASNLAGNTYSAQIDCGLEVKYKYFFYKNHIYVVVKELKMKHPVTREWVECVEYKRADENYSGNGQSYIREKVEFYERFEHIELKSQLYLI